MVYHYVYQDHILCNTKLTSTIYGVSSCKPVQYLCNTMFKDIYLCPIEIIKGLTDKGQFLYLTKLKGSQKGTNLYTTQFFFTKIKMNIL